MNTSTPLSDGLIDEPTLAGTTTGSAPGRLSRASVVVVRLLTARPTWSPAWSILLVTILVGIVGAVDSFTTPFVSFRPFYYIPIAFSVSWLGWRAASATSFACVTVWVIGDYYAESPWIRGAGLVAVWNICIALTTFHIMVWTLQLLLSLHRDMEERVRQRTRSLQQALGVQERLRSELLEVGSRERNAVGRELHDGLCQHLAATAFAAQVHADRLGTVNPQEAESARAIVAMMQEGITHSRQVASGLLLRGITPETLPTHLQEFAAAISREVPTFCRFELEGRPTPADSDAAAQFFRIAQEAVRNAVKHAHATEINVQLAGDKTEVRLTVTDNGVGLPAASHRPAGMGLDIMAHRAGSIGAEFSMSPRPGGGTAIACRWRAARKS